MVHCSRVFLSLFYLVSIIISSVCSQSTGRYQIAIVIDDFEIEAEELVLVVPPDSQFPVRGLTSTLSEDIIGGERDLILVIEEGVSNSDMTTTVFDGRWYSNAASCSGFSSLQYDGNQGVSSMFVDHSGLNCLDLTAQGQADSFIIEAQSTARTDFKFTVYDSQGRISSIRIEVQESSDDVPYYVKFSDFMGNVNFTCVGAIEITPTVNRYSMFSVSTLLVGRATTDNPSASHTRTPTPTPTPNHPFASASRTPSRFSNTSDVECMVDSDCHANYCEIATCSLNSCEIRIKHQQGCCRDTSDCPERECYTAECTYVHSCQYHSYDCSADSESDNSGSYLWVIGVVFGALFLVCVIIGIFAFIGWRIKKSRQNAHEVYDAMIGLS